jgi:5,10-methylenetetrahydrofolate reductase
VTGPAGRLERILRAGEFGVTAEVVPPRSTDGAVVTEQARSLVGYADAVNVNDNPTAHAHMSPLAGAALVAAAGIEPTLQINSRDRNRLAITSDLLGGWALGARNLLCLTGDPVSVGDHPDAKPVHDLQVLELVRLAASLRNEGRALSGEVIAEAPGYFIGVADPPLAAEYDPGRLEAKLEAGAEFVQTQIVYDLEALAAWADRVRERGIFERAFVLVGVAPLRSARTARYMNENVPGVTVPDRIVRSLEEAGPDAEAKGVRMAVDIVNGLKGIDGVAGVHVMGLGREESVRRVIEAAGLTPRPTGAG